MSVEAQERVKAFVTCRARRLGLVGLLALGPAALAETQTDAEAAFAEAERHLEGGRAAEAEAAARDAIRLSLRFVPEQEIGARPDKGLLFEDMILEARARYRERRARYFHVLGDALTAQEKYRAARKAFRRSPSLDGVLAMAGHPDLSLDERIELLIDAYFSHGADTTALETELLETRAFRSRHALDASLDRRRFRDLALRFDGEAVELLPRAFPELSVVTDAGTLNTGQLFRSGNLLVVYVPEEGCGRCSEELDGITAPVSNMRRDGGIIEAVALVREADLPGARRIVRLLGMELGVGRKDGVPPNLAFREEGEIRIVGRGGLVQIRIPMSRTIAAGQIRPRVEAALELLDDAEVLRADRERKAQPIVTLERDRGASEKAIFHDWVETIDRLEAGPAPVDDLYAELGRVAGAVSRSQGDARELGVEMLAALSRLDGAHTAKTTALGLLGDQVGERLLERAQALDAAVRRTAPGTEGVFHAAVGVGGSRVYIQRSYRADGGLRHFDFVLELRPSNAFEIVWASPEAAPLGAASVDEGAVFLYEDEAGCRGLKLVATASQTVAREGCGARLIGGDLVEVRPALVETSVDGADERLPRYHRRDITVEREPTALERGLDAFGGGDYRGAAAAFEEALAEIDAEAPYDASDLVYNRARALELAGDRVEALELYRSLGDVAYQYLVDERANAIETGQAPRD